MKMNIEEKAKRYDEAIDRANSLLSSNQLGNAWIYKLLPELKKSKESEDERIRKGLIGYFLAGKCESISSYHGVSTDDILAWLEKQGEQKSNDNEHKFHEGEWITNGDYTWKIVEVKSLDYILQSQDGNIVDDTISHVDEQFHSFTIKDAKNGDVLTWDNGRYIILFKEIKDNIVAYCSYNTHSKHFGFYSDYDTQFDCIFNFTPATKEQHDLLFQKMKEADYKLDVEKKEFIKIDQKPADNIKPKFKVKYAGSEYNVFEVKDIAGVTFYGIEDEPNHIDYVLPDNCEIIFEQNHAHTWNEEDENYLNSIEKLIMGSRHTGYNGISRKDAITWLKSQVRPQQKQEWSEKVKEALNKIVEYLKYKGLEDDADFLKSLNPQNRWKPSDEQMLAINTSINIVGKGTINGKYLIELHEELKKLREK